jgi:serine/threonine protein phosphatase PrpC
MNKDILPHSLSISIENYKDRYHSPKRPFQEEKNLSEFHNFSHVSKIRLEKYNSSKNFDSLVAKKIDFTTRDNKTCNKNKKIQMINEYKSNAIGVKISGNVSIRKIQISPREKNLNNNTNVNSNNKNENVNNTLSNIKSNKEGDKIKRIHSYTTSKLQENQSQYGQLQIRKNLNKKSFIKGINILDNNKFKKSVSTEINYTLNNKIIEKDISLNNTVTSHELLNEDNYKKRTLEIQNDNNVEEVKYMNYKNKEINSHKVLLKNKLKKQRSEIINNDKPEKIVNSQQQLIINKRKPDEDTKVENNLIKQNSKILILYEYNPTNYTEKKISKKNESNKIIPIINSNLSRNNNNNKALHSMDKINNNFIHTILSSKTNPSNQKFLENNSSYYSKKNTTNKIINLFSTKNQKQKNRRLSDFSKFESRRPSIQIYHGNMKNNEIDNEEEWDHAQYMGIRKTTYDPGSRPRRNKNKNIVNLLKNAILNSEFSHNAYIKSCESITVPGKKENGNKKINQDTFIIERNINGVLNFNIFGVLDGHGEYGHYASQFVSRHMISHIKNHPLIKKCDDPKEIYQKLILNGYEIIANLFTDADVQIQKEKFDVQNSGTTCVIVIQLEEKIICANTGDSRAIIIYNKDNNDNLVNTKIYNLSYDCKPELPNECKRIYECGGCVEKALDDNDQEGGPYRVWVYGEDYPGLAMSRSIGDLDAKKIGVIPNPQIVEYTIDSNSKYMLIASDGIWEFISNEEAMRIGNKFYLRNDATGLCNELYKESVNFWIKEYCIIDDITLIVVFF